MYRKLLTAVISVSMLVAVALDTRAQVVNPKVFGKTYGEWGAEWWKWALAGPDGANAVQDTTGEFCAVNQPARNVWFLAGTFGSSVVRTCTIPADRALFYPLVNTFWVDCPNSPDEDLTDDKVRAILVNFTSAGDRACQLTSTLDGVAISSKQILTVRTQSPRFTSILPEEHILRGACLAPPDFPRDLPPGETGRMIAEGYWIMLPPLSPGVHELTLQGAGCNADTGAAFFQTAVTYHLNVVR